MHISKNTTGACLWMTSSEKKGVVLCGFFCLDSPDTEKEFSVNKLIVCSYTMSTDRQGRIHKLNLLNRREEENRQILTENCLAVF